MFTMYGMKGQYYNSNVKEFVTQYFADIFSKTPLRSPTNNFRKCSMVNKNLQTDEIGVSFYADVWYERKIM